MKFILGLQLEWKVKIKINKKVKIAGNCARNGKIKIRKLLIKFIKFIIINLKFKRDFFNN